MRLVFMGTPNFALPTLGALAKAGHEMVGVYAQPDKPKGRGHQLLPPPVKEAALSLGIPVFQPKTLRTPEALLAFQALRAELVVVVAYGKILPPSFLEFPRYGCINGHASLLPRYRGAAPIQWAILSGETETGITVMRMSKGMDEGDILLTQKTEIFPEETAGELFERLAPLCAESICQAVEKMEQDQLTPIPQNLVGVSPTFAPPLSKEMAPLDFEKSAFDLHNQVRGLNPWPVATCCWKGKTVKVFSSCVEEEFNSPVLPGTIAVKDRLVVACKKGAICLLEVQMEGKKRVSGTDFMRGYHLKEGDRFF